MEHNNGSPPHRIRKRLTPTSVLMDIVFVHRPVRPCEMERDAYSLVIVGEMTPCSSSWSFAHHMLAKRPPFPGFVEYLQE